MTFCLDKRISILAFYYKFKNNIINIIQHIKDIFNISKSTLYKWLQISKIHGSPIIKPQGRPLNSGKITSSIQNYIVSTYQKNNKIFTSIKNIKRSIHRIFKVTIKKSTIYYILKKNNITCKHISVSKYPYSNKKLKDAKTTLKNKLINRITNKMKNNVYSFDECFMSPENLERIKGWSKKGVRCIKKINGRRYKEGRSLLLVISNKKIIAKRIIKGTVNGEIVRDFLMNDVLKNKNNKIIFMDNARTHHYKELIKDINKTTNKIVYNIPYHPQTNPIEFINNVIKNDLKKKGTLNISSLNKELNKSIKKVSS